MVRTFYAKCRCRRYVACDSVWDYDLKRWAQKHADECGQTVVIGECPPNICYGDQIFHYYTVRPRKERNHDRI